LRDIFKKACRDINDYAERSERFTKMATTMVAAVVVKNTLFVANVGDSRAYRIRNGKVQQITRDHSVVEEMVRSGAMTEEEARVSRIRNQLSRSIGGEYNVEVDVFTEIPLQIGDKILLCSDGFSRYATDDDILKLISSGEPEEAARQMVNFANRSGGADNITATVIEIVKKAKKHKGPMQKQEGKPDLEEWQKAETEYPLAQPEPGGKKPNPLTIILPVLAVTVVILAFFLLRSDLFRKILGSDEASAQLTTTPEIFLPEDADAGEQPVQMPNGVEPLDEERSEDQMQPTEDTSANEEGEATPEGAEGLTEGIGDEPVPPAPNGADTMPEQDWECVYLYQSDDFLSWVLEDFGKKFSDEEIYYYYSDCVLDNDENMVIDCSPYDPLVVDNPHQVFEQGVNKWVIIYNSQNDEEKWDKSECVKEDRNGKIYFLRDVGGQE
jgi:serine/threonine protein phosphatase PrpC